MAFIMNKVSFDKKNKNSQFVFETESLKTDIIFSVVIGANGTGKSLFLQKLIQSFRELENIQNITNNRYEVLDYYLIDYTLNTNRYRIEKDNKKYTFFINNEESRIEDIELPKTLLALSFLQEDKFIFQSGEDNKKSFYKYLGTRNTTNAVFVGTINKKIREILFENMNRPDFSQKMVDTFHLLGYEAKVKINFDYKLKSMVSTKITKKTINQKIKTINKNSKYKHIELSENEKDMILKFIHKRRVELNSITSKYFTSVIFDFNANLFPVEEYSIIKNMIKLELLAQSGIELYRSEDGVNSEFLSSGEKNLLFITLNILANATDEVMILIDEPEISLHPNWQVKYNTHLKKILYGYKNVHVFIATHSHFIVSGLKVEEANIFTINLNKDVEFIEEDIYSWSAENILYRVFQTRTVNNHYIEMELRKIFKLIAKNNSEDRQKIIKSYENIQKITFHQDDPLYTLTQKIKQYLEKKE